MPEGNPTHAIVTHYFDTSPETIFDAWLDPDMIGRFMFGPNLRDEEIVSLQVTPHVGGSFSFVVRRNDLEIDHIGEYLEIDRPKHLVFSRTGKATFLGKATRLWKNRYHRWSTVPFNLHSGVSQNKVLVK